MHVRSVPLLAAQELQQLRPGGASRAAPAESAPAPLPSPAPGTGAGAALRLSPGILAALMNLHEGTEVERRRPSREDEPADDQGDGEPADRDCAGKDDAEGEENPEEREPDPNGMSEAQQRAALFLQQMG